MFFIDLLLALVVALLLAAVFTRVLGRRGPWGAAVAFFTVVFLFTWAGGIWVTPFGPLLWGAYVFPFLLIGTLIALVLAAATPGPPRARRPVEQGPMDAETASRVDLTTFFWVLVVLLLGGILAHYLTV